MRARLLVALYLGGSSLSGAMAQTSTAEPGAEAVTESSSQIGDIVVTAQRRTEKAQDVPISLQSFSPDMLQQTGVQSTEDLTTLVGGLIVQPSATRSTIFLRGVGTNTSSTTAAVLTFVDGVYMPFGQVTDLGNISSLEVLKGPQGTLFGRNATGGVIQVTTQLPSETPSARGEIGYGNYQTVDVSAYATGGLAKGIAMDISLRYSNQADGYGTNIFNGEDVFAARRSAVRSRLLFGISDTTKLILAGDYSTTHGNVGTTLSPAFGYGTAFILGAQRRRGDAFFPGDYDINAGPVTPYFRSWEWGGSATLETELSDLTVRNIFAYRRNFETSIIDFDAGPADVLELEITRTPRSMISEELQILSPTSGALQWVAGLYYYRTRQVVSPFRVNTVTENNTAIDESIAPYAQATYEILPETRLTVGGRYTIEKRSTKGGVFFGGVPIPGTSGKVSLKFKEPTWRIALDHRLSPAVLVYASASRGFNSGYFNDSSFDGYANKTQAPPVLPEFLTAYEIGTKTDLLNRRLRINLSAFWYDYKGLQQQVYDVGAIKTINAGSARIKGIDFEVIARPVSSLTLSLSGTYLDAKYISYVRAPNYTPQPDGSITANSNLDAAGRMIAKTPKISYTANISHVLETAVGDFTTTANLNYRGKSYIDPNNRFPLPTRYVLGVSEKWTSLDKHLFATLWVKNLLDKRYDYSADLVTPIGIVGQPAPPRTYGASIGFEF